MVYAMHLTLVFAVNNPQFMLKKIVKGSLSAILWVVLALLAGAVAYQIFTTVLIAGVWLNESQYRPLYWSSFRLKWLARFTALILGISYVFYISLLGNLIEDWQQRNRLKAGALRLAGLLLLVLLISLGIAQILVI